MVYPKILIDFFSNPFKKLTYKSFRDVTKDCKLKITLKLRDHFIEN
jgi:hypothetical protein